MTSWSTESLVLTAAAGVLSFTGLVWLAHARPRVALYLMFALAPTQFVFFPVSSFFVSPADVLLTTGAIALALRLALGRARSWAALYQHRFIVLMIASYLTGFLLLDVFSRTVVRLPMAVAVSVLACELLCTRRQLARAAAALVAAGALDAGYGLFRIASGAPLHPTRFSGLSGVNFSAMMILAAAATALAWRGWTRRLAGLAAPATLAGFGLATLSQMGVLALLTAWIVVLRRAMSRRNQWRLVAAAALVLTLALTMPRVQEEILGRNTPQVQTDGVARSSADIRISLLRTGLEAVLDQPIVGLGYSRSTEYSTRDPQIFSSSSGRGYPTHNTYLEIAMEGGLVALALFGLHFVQYFPGLVLTLRAAAAARDSLPSACLIGLPMMLVCAGLANVLLLYVFWAFCGLGLACLNVMRQEREASISRTPYSTDPRLSGPMSPMGSR